MPTPQNPGVSWRKLRYCNLHLKLLSYCRWKILHHHGKCFKRPIRYSYTHRPYIYRKVIIVSAKLNSPHNSYETAATTTSWTMTRDGILRSSEHDIENVNHVHTWKFHHNGIVCFRCECREQDTHTAQRCSVPASREYFYLWKNVLILILPPLLLKVL